MGINLAFTKSSNFILNLIRRNGEAMKYMKIVIIPFLLITVSIPSWAARRLVDDFNGPTIDFTKWSGVFDSTTLSADEFDGRIDAAAGNLVMNNASDGSTYQRFRTNVLNTTLDELQATVSVVSVNDGGSKAAANVEGEYYNSNSATPTDAFGDVFATVSIGDRGNGLEAWWRFSNRRIPISRPGMKPQV